MLFTGLLHHNLPCYGAVNHEIVIVCVVTVVLVIHRAVFAVSLIGLTNVCDTHPFIAGYNPNFTVPPEPSSNVIFPAVAQLEITISVIYKDNQAQGAVFTDVFVCAEA